MVRKQTLTGGILPGVLRSFRVRAISNRLWSSLYVACRLGLAILIVLTAALMWIARNQGVEANVLIQFRGPEAPSAAAFRDRAVSELKDLTSDDWLAELFRRVECTRQAESSTPPQPQGKSFCAQDFEEVRRNLSFSIRPQIDPRQFRLRVSYKDSSRDGPKLVEMLVATWVQRIQAQEEKSGAPVARSTGVPMWQMELERALLLTQRIQAELQRWERDTRTETRPSLTTQSGNPTLASPEQPFYSASYPRPAPEGNTNETTQANIYENLLDASRQATDILQRLQRELCDREGMQPSHLPTSQKAPRWVSMKPVAVGQTLAVQLSGPLASRYYLLFASMLSFGLGAYLSLRWGGRGETRERADLAEIEQCVGGPVLAVVAQGKSPRKVKKSPPLAPILKLSEMLILVTFVMVAVLAALRPEFRQSLWADPLRALSQIVWALRG